jgi:hypothetical protein
MAWFSSVVFPVPTCFIYTIVILLQYQRFEILNISKDKTLYLSEVLSGATYCCLQKSYNNY